MEPTQPPAWRGALATKQLPWGGPPWYARDGDSPCLLRAGASRHQDRYFIREGSLIVSPATTKALFPSRKTHLTHIRSPLEGLPRFQGVPALRTDMLR